MRGERVGGTEGDGEDVHDVGERTVGINKRNVEPGPTLGLDMAKDESSQSWQGRFKCDVVVTVRDRNVTRSIRQCPYATNEKEKENKRRVM